MGRLHTKKKTSLAGIEELTDEIRKLRERQDELTKKVHSESEAFLKKQPESQRSWRLWLFCCLCGLCERRRRERVTQSVPKPIDVKDQERKVEEVQADADV